jgi:ribulose-phosphate 3-epimerase
VTAIETESVDGCSEHRPRFAELRASLPVVVPALLMCDFGHLADEIQRIEAAGAQVLHLDVMDGHFVSNLTYGLTIVDAVRRYTALPIETHLMISNPGEFVKAYHNAGADQLTFHVEAVRDPRPVLEAIHRVGAGAGLALNPPTPISAVEPYLAECDTILVMSVMPGFGGQEFDVGALDKLRALRKQVSDRTMLAVDGGIHPATIGPATAAGAELVVAGSAIFGQENYRQALHELTSLAAAGARSAGGRTASKAP